MDMEQVKELMQCLEASKLRKMVYKKGDFELHLEKEEAPLSPARKVVVAEPAAVAESAPSAHVKESAGSFVTSPMVGTFYGSPAPDQPHFVKVGDRVEEGTIVCIIEAMKVMNEVKAGRRGTIGEILVHNGQPVEFGSRLFRIVE